MEVSVVNKSSVSLQDKPTSFLQPARGMLQRMCACGNKTIAGGECTECAKKKSGLQRKLAVGASNDPLELEADRVADQVMATPAHHAVNSAPLRIQRFSGQPTGQSDIAPDSVDRVLASSGRPLESALRQDMEQRFVHDFSGVRVHFDEAGAKSARDVSAHAYTVGRHIVFDTGRFAPGTQEGSRLLAHELTHVVQQAGAKHSLMRVCDCTKIGARKPDPKSKDKLETGIPGAFPGLVSDDWCILDLSTPTYNCYAWSVSDTSQWIDTQVDSVYGNKDGTLSFADFDAFYDTEGLYPQSAPDSNTKVALFAKGSAPQHAARTADVASCGTIPFTSKLGKGPLIAHDLFQLEGSTYGKVARYYG